MIIKVILTYFVRVNLLQNIRCRTIQLIESKANIVEYEEVIKKNDVKIIACEAQLSNESLSLSETAKLKELKQKILFENIEIYVAIVIEKEVVSSNEQLMKNTIVRAEFKNWTLDTNH